MVPVEVMRREGQIGSPLAHVASLLTFNSAAILRGLAFLLVMIGIISVSASMAGASLRAKLFHAHVVGQVDTKTFELFRGGRKLISN